MKDLKALRAPQAAYRSVDGVLYLPHYKLEGIFVGPGGKKLYPSTLERRGCEAVMLDLWIREYVDPRSLR